MPDIQNILVYITLFIAVAFLVKKFFFPKFLFSSTKKNKPSKACGQDGCGCH